jgi:hypothetical protein
MTLKEARERGEMFFHDRVCDDHPELNGVRRTASRACPSCIRERMGSKRQGASKAWHKRRAEYERKRREAKKAGTWSPRKYRKAGEVK